MKEKPGLSRAILLFQLFRKQEEMVVLDPDYIVRGRLVCDGLGESLIDGDVGGKILTVEYGQVQSIVHDWPKDAVGVAQIESLIICLRHVDQGEGHATFFGQIHAPPGHVKDLAAPADPQAACFGQRVRQGYGEPASAGAAKRRAIGDGDEATGRMWTRFVHMSTWQGYSRTFSRFRSAASDARIMLGLPDFKAVGWPDRGANGFQHGVSFSIHS